MLFVWDSSFFSLFCCAIMFFWKKNYGKTIKTRLPRLSWCMVCIHSHSHICRACMLGKLASTNVFLLFSHLHPYHLSVSPARVGGRHVCCNATASPWRHYSLSDRSRFHSRLQPSEEHWFSMPQAGNRKLLEETRNENIDFSRHELLLFIGTKTAYQPVAMEETRNFGMTFIPEGTSYFFHRSLIPLESNLMRVAWWAKKGSDQWHMCPLNFCNNCWQPKLSKNAKWVPPSYFYHQDS